MQTPVHSLRFISTKHTHQLLGRIAYLPWTPGRHQTDTSAAGPTQSGASHASSKGRCFVAVVCKDVGHRRAPLQGLQRQLPTPQHVLQVLELQVAPALASQGT